MEEGNRKTKESSIRDIKRMLETVRNCEILIRQRDFKIDAVELKQRKFYNKKDDSDFFFA